MKRVLIESPYAGDVEGNVAYARACVLDCLRRGEAPYASHLFFTQPGLLDDREDQERALGIEAGLAWGAAAELTAAYTDRGFSGGMRAGLERARLQGRPVEYRSLRAEAAAPGPGGATAGPCGGGTEKGRPEPPFGS